MVSRRLLGIVFLIVGIVLFTIGMNSSHSFADKMSDAFTGRFTETTTWYIVGGIGVAALGLVLTLTGLGKSNA